MEGKKKTPPAPFKRFRRHTSLRVGTAPRACRVIVENCTQLNDAVMFDPRFPALFTVNFATSILGMFELNCLGVTVESPVEDLRDEMRSTKKRDGSLGVNVQLKEHFRTTEAIFKLLGTTDVPCDVRAARPADAVHKRFRCSPLESVPSKSQGGKAT